MTSSALAGGIDAPWSSAMVPPASALPQSSIVADGAMSPPAARNRALAALPEHKAATSTEARPASGRFRSLAGFDKCLARAAKLQHVSPSVLLTIIHTEAGWNGAMIGNVDGSHDLGIMQVNDRTWDGVLARDEFHTDTRASRAAIRYMLRFDDCYNINVGAWIFSDYYRQAHGNLGEAVGWYNSHDPISMRRYQSRFVASLRALFGPQTRKNH